MVRRTITLPDHLDGRVRKNADEGESFSAAVSRLLEAGLDGKRVPSYVGLDTGGGDDVSLRVEELLAEHYADPDFEH